MVAKLSSQKYNGTRGKQDLLKRINEKLLKIHPDDLSPELVWSTYGLHQLTCGKHNVPNPKSSNCKENPYCLGRLGLEKFEKLIKMSEALRNDKMVETIRRDTIKQPCGLINSANFCYVNSFLQIWFNDPVFRQIIYDWLPSEEYVIPAPPAMDVQKVMTTLQHLFFTLDTSPYEEADGEAFCTALRLNQEQQDAQEFTVMFFDSIDRNLMKHPNGRMMRERIGERFNGLQTSSLRCKCGHHSDNTTKFSALNLSIDGHTTLSAAIAGYFADERLDDFACSGCSKRGGVKRETRIDHLPPVLLLSLNRYVYDSATGRRKKLKTPLQYPRLLSVDGLPHGEQLSEEDSRYELSAVMVHEGDNADCGHYWDIIRHPYSGVWFKYNDKIVKETKAPGVETEKAEPPTKPNIDLKYCYGLVYRRKEASKPCRHPPEEISGKWTKEMDHKFYRMTDTDAQASELTLQEVTQRFCVVGDHMAALEVKPDRANQKRARDLAFLPTKLLSGILATEYSRANQLKEKLTDLAKELDSADCEKEDEAAAASQSDTDLSSPQKRKKNARRRVKSMYDKRLEQVEIAECLAPASLLLCPHERIAYDSVHSGDVKAVNRAGAEKLIKDYGLAVNVVTADGVARSDRLRTGLEVCTECVQQKTRDVHFADRLDDDVRLAAAVHKEVNTRCSVKAFFNKDPPSGSFYVAKSALASFKKDALSERQRSNKAREEAPRCTWTIGPADAARAEREGGKEERKRRKRAGGVEREMAGGEGAEKEPVTKCPRSAEKGENGRDEDGEGEGGEGEEDEDKEMSEEVEEAVRDMIPVAGPATLMQRLLNVFRPMSDMMDELAGPSQATLSSSSLNGHSTAAASAASAAATAASSASLASPSKDVKMEVDESEAEPREAAGRNTRTTAVKKEMKEEEAEDEDEPMEEDDEDGKREEVKEVKKKEIKKEKREGKEGSAATDDSDQSSSPVTNDGENGKEEEAENGRASSNEEDDADAGPIEFNDKLRCDHGGINVTEFRHMVTAEEWDKLSRYFENSFVVSTHKPVCEACKSFDASATLDKQASSAIIKGLNEAVGDVVKSMEKKADLIRRGFKADVHSPDMQCTRGVCSRFVERARKVIKPRAKGGSLPPLCQQCVMCDHGRPRYETAPMQDVTKEWKANDALFLVPITADEWVRLKTAWSTAMVAAGGVEEGEDDGDFSAVDIELCPISGAVNDQCAPCNESLRIEIEEAKYVYDSADIYVKMQTDESAKTTGGDKEKEKEEKGKEGKDKDKEKGSKEGSKEKDKEELPDIIPLEIVTAPANGSNGGGRLCGAVTVGGRTTTRRGASKGLLKVRMCSSQTVKDLKIALLKHVNYSPVDQLLYSTLGGEPLEDELSLMEARIAPDNFNSPIILIVQSGADELASPTNEKTRAVERGFYDTALAH